MRYRGVTISLQDRGLKRKLLILLILYKNGGSMGTLVLQFYG